MNLNFQLFSTIHDKNNMLIISFNQISRLHDYYKNIFYAFFADLRISLG